MVMMVMGIYYSLFDVMIIGLWYYGTPKCYDITVVIWYYDVIQS